MSDNGQAARLEVSTGALSKIRARYGELSASERQASDFVSANAERVVGMSLAEVARGADVSEATVLRFARSIGFAGFGELKVALAVDAATPIEGVFEAIDESDDPPAIVRKVLQYNVQLLQDTLTILDDDAAQRAVDCLAEARRVLVYGVGTSGPVAMTAANLLFRLGIAAEPVTDGMLQAMHSVLLDERDAVLAVSRSGAPAQLATAVAIARRQGARTIALTTDRRSRLAQASEIALVGAAREIRTEAIASSVSLTTLADALYVALALRDRERTVRRERDIWSAMRELRGAGGETRAGRDK